MAKLVRRHTSNVEIISSNLVGSIYRCQLVSYITSIPGTFADVAFIRQRNKLQWRYEVTIFVFFPYRIAYADNPGSTKYIPYHVSED